MFEGDCNVAGLPLDQLRRLTFNERKLIVINYLINFSGIGKHPQAVSG